MAFLVGAALGVFVLYSIWEFVLFKRVFDDPLRGKLSALVAAYLTAATLYGFGAADGGPYRTEGFWLYLIGAIPTGIYAWHRGMKLREQPERVLEADVFD